ncbi:MAG: glycosyltransferase family 4 protein [Candidatus Eremiobacteraeota bacterium]|nr:glycosyltransferase family 4 protein [Candidatus Eremiobacteraeota bacterium]
MSRRISILSIANDVPHGGDENRLLSFSQHIDRDRFDHHVVIVKAADPAIDARFGTLRGEFRARGIPLIELGMRRPGHAVGSDRLRRLPHAAATFARSVAKLSRLVRELHVDVLDGHIGTGNQLAVATGFTTRKPVAVTTYHAEVFTPRWLWYPVQQATLRGADVIITDSHQRADAMRGFLRAPRAPIEIIANGIDAEPPRRPAAEVAAELGIPPSAIVVGQIAGMVPTKGWAPLIEAAAQVLARDPRAFFLCIGHDRYAPWFRPQLQARAEELGIADRIRLVSYPGHNADVWQLFDVHVHASLFDSLPNAIIEGMAYGKPAVVTDVGDCARTVIDGVSGIVVPPNDPSALAGALLRMLADPALRARCGAAARARYELGHRPEVMTDGLQALFERMAA